MPLGFRNTPIQFVSQSIREGVLFNAKIEEPALPDGNFIDFLINPNDELITMVAAISLEGDGRAQLFENVTVSANGTPIVPLNRNRNSDFASMIQMFDAPTVTGTGTTIADITFFGGQRQQAIITEFESNPEIILNKKFLYIIRLTNNSGSDSFADISTAFLTV